MGQLAPLRYLKRPTLVFTVTDRRKDISAGVASTHDFALTSAGRVVPNYALERSIIYCCDVASERVWYTIVPDVRAVFDSVFVYQAQRAMATHVLSVPLEVLEEREHFVHPQPVFVFSIGRCGSTLLSSLLKATGRLSISEPDIFTQLAVLRPIERLVLGGVGTSEIIRSSVASFARLCGRRTFLKLRHHCNVLWPQINLATPDANLVFMLRDRIDWARSRHRVFGDGPEALVTVLRDGIVCLDSMIRGGLTPMIVWYEDLISDPFGTLQCLGIESDGRGFLDRTVLDGALQVDSQDGTSLSRKNIRPRESEENCLRAFDALWQQEGLSQTIRRLNIERLL
jgi:hypothetical protein